MSINKNTGLCLFEKAFVPMLCLACRKLQMLSTKVAKLTLAVAQIRFNHVHITGKEFHLNGDLQLCCQMRYLTVK